jgi:hypothetical protein
VMVMRRDMGATSLFDTSIFDDFMMFVKPKGTGPV